MAIYAIMNVNIFVVQSSQYLRPFSYSYDNLGWEVGRKLFFIGVLTGNQLLELLTTFIKLLLYK